MSSPLLIRFSTTIVTRLIADDRIAVRPGREQAVVEHLARFLASVTHASLVSSIARGLLASDDVEELWADDDDLKAIVDDMDRGAAGL